MRAAMKYDSFTGMMTVRQFDDAGRLKGSSKVVNVSTLRSIGDADIAALIGEAMTFSGQEIRMPKFNRNTNRATGGLRHAA